MTNEMEELAKAYAAEGYPVFPVRPNKAPWTKNGFKDATTDIEVIERWWRQRPEARPAMPTGQASGIVVVDVDVKRGVDGPGNWERLSEEFLEGLASPWIVDTPSGGKHEWFRDETGWTNSAGDLAPGVDIRGEGGYVVLYGPPPDVELPALPLFGVVGTSAPNESDDSHDLNVDTGDLPISWSDILAPHNYAKCSETTWTRPGKTCAEGHSLSIWPEKPWLIRQFSGTAGVPVRLWSKQTLFQELNPGKSLPTKRKRLQVTKASDIGIARTRWFWDGRIAMGTLALLAGRQDIGKSTLAYKIAAEVTTGRLMGEYLGQPRGVIIVATEDAWRETINPRLLASGANMDLVYKVEAADPDDYGISLPTDIDELAEITRELDCSLILLDPLMSRVDKNFDTHKDSEVRKALEPLVKMAELAGAAVLGLIHVNKGGNSDPLNSIMASAAFTAVSRAVLYVVKDPDDEDIRIMGQVKNNLGKSGLPELQFCITPVEVGWDDGPITGTTLTWKGEVEPGKIQEILSTKTTKSKVEDAALWLEQYLNQHGKVPRDQVIADSDYPEHTLKRALKQIGGISERQGEFRPRSVWYLPGHEIIEEAS